MSDPIIIVGASQAGLQVAESLRAEGYDGPLVMLGDEAHPPYQALLETIPTLLMTCEEPGLIGCGVLANERAVTA